MLDEFTWAEVPPEVAALERRCQLVAAVPILLAGCAATLVALATLSSRLLALCCEILDALG